MGNTIDELIEISIDVTLNIQQYSQAYTCFTVNYLSLVGNLLNLFFLLLISPLSPSAAGHVVA